MWCPLLLADAILSANALQIPGDGSAPTCSSEVSTSELPVHYKQRLLSQPITGSGKQGPPNLLNKALSAPGNQRPPKPPGFETREAGVAVAGKC